jgi:hypothetical protein
VHNLSALWEFSYRHKRSERKPSEFSFTFQNAGSSVRMNLTWTRPFKLYLSAK